MSELSSKFSPRLAGMRTSHANVWSDPDDFRSYNSWNPMRMLSSMASVIRSATIFLVLPFLRELCLRHFHLNFLSSGFPAGSAPLTFLHGSSSESVSLIAVFFISIQLYKRENEQVTRVLLGIACYERPLMAT